jgi:pilus assembly protein CpaB
VVELAPQIQSQDVLVAADKIGQGQRISAENVRWQPWPDEAINGEYIQKQTMPDAVEKLDGSVVRSPFVAGEPIRNVKLSRPESGFLSAILPSGKRAVAVRVSAQSTAGGFILPGDRVDVVQTISQQASPDMPAENVSRTILTNIKVLAIDQTVDERDGEPVVVGKTATLELDPAQVELITSAEASGTLSLSLRSITDTDEVVSATEKKQSGTVRIYRFGRGRTVTTQ